MISIETLKAHLGKTVDLNAWVTRVRSSGKIAFLQLRDGTGFIQSVIVKNEVPEDVFALAKGLNQETSLKVRGEVRQDDRSPLGVELGIISLELYQSPQDYPITPKEHGVEFLFDHRHLHLRHRKPWATLRIRDELERGMHDFFSDRGFIRFDVPLFMSTAAEDTTNLFEIDLFGEDKAYLSQSGQLYAEAGAMAFGKVYTFGPTFRAEKSKTRKHLLEFWMIEPEVAFLDHQGNMQLQEDMLSYLVKRILDKKAYELELLERDLTKLEPASQGKFPRITYDHALEVLAKKGLGLEWGEDFGAPHETALGEDYDRPIFIEAWPTKAKAFYMQPFENDPDRVKCADLIAPDGYGELIGGSERIHDLALLEQRIKEHKLPEAALKWYLDLRRFGSVPHSGFGIGIERTLAWIVGADHVREVIPFPRMLTRMEP